MILMKMSIICWRTVQCPSKMAVYRYENAPIYSLNILAKWLDQVMYKGNRREKNKVQTSEKVKKVVVFLRASPTGSTLEFSEAGAQRRPRQKKFRHFWGKTAVKTLLIPAVFSSFLDVKKVKKQKSEQTKRHWKVKKQKILGPEPGQVRSVQVRQ